MTALTADRQILWRDLLLGAATPYGLTQLEGWQSLPDMRVSNSDRPGRHGQYPGSMYASGRVITATYRISRGPRLPAAVEALRAALAPSENPAEEQLTVAWDGARRMVLARAERHALTMDPRWTVGYATGSIQWTATDPRQYSTELHTAATGLPEPVRSGLAFPLAFPLDFGPGTRGGDMTVTNAGNAAVWPVWVITGPVVGPVITCLDTGRVLAFGPSFRVEAGQQLVIDTDARSVLLAGSASRRDQMTAAQWFPLLPGSPLRVGFSASSYDAGARLSVQWRDAWM